MSKKSKKSPPRMQAGAAIYIDGLGSDSEERRAALAASQAKSVRRIGDESQGPKPSSGALNSEDLS